MAGWSHVAASTSKTSMTCRSLRLHPKHRVLAHYYHYYMMLMALLLSVAVFLQGATILQSQSAENTSLPAYILLTIVALSWLAYGVLWSDTFVTFSGAVFVVASVLALVATVSYRPGLPPGAFVEVS